MAHIKVLDQITIDKIAAGEVIERPASIVKELTENAIDAGADSVTVEIEDGGITLIRISDNGSGIEREDIHNAFLRHSTSKIESVDDLMHISSLRFPWRSPLKHCCRDKSGTDHKTKGRYIRYALCDRGWKRNFYGRYRRVGRNYVSCPAVIL